MLRVTAISDQHGYLPDTSEWPEADLTLIGGDLCPVEDHEEGFQLRWLRTDYADWLKTIKGEKVGVAGNHDFVAQRPHGKDVLRKLDWHYLENEAVEVCGLKVWGSPYSNRFGGWAFMAAEEGLAHIWRSIPRDIDILVIHGPAKGFGDGVPSRHYSVFKKAWIEDAVEHAGSGTLTHQLRTDEWPNLKLFIFGHIHEGYGKYKLNNIKLLNASVRDSGYKPVNPVWHFELEVE